MTKTQKGSRAQSQKNQKQIRDVDIWIEQHPAHGEEADYNKAKLARSEREPEIEARLKFLAEKVAPIESQIQQTAAQNTELKNTALQRDGEVTTAQNKLTKSIDDQEISQKNATATADALQQLSGDSGLAELVRSLDLILNDWEKLPSSDEELPTREAIQAQKQQWGTKLQILLGTCSSLGELSTECDRWQQLKENKAKLDEKSRQKREEEATLQALEDRETQMQQKVALSKDVLTEARKNEKSTLLIIELQSQLDELHQRLLDGKIAQCPCCGAPREAMQERPLQNNENLEKARQAVENAQKELDDLNKAKEEISTAKNTAETNIANLKIQICEFQGEIDKVLRAIGLQEIPGNVAEQCEALNLRHSKLEALETQRPELDNLTALDAQRSKLRKELPPAEQSICLKSLTDAKSLVKQLKKRSAAYQEAFKEERDCAYKLKLAEEDRKRNELALTEARQKSSEADAKAQESADTLKNLQAQLKELGPVKGSAKEETDILLNEKDKLLKAEENARERWNAFNEPRQQHLAIKKRP